MSVPIVCLDEELLALRGLDVPETDGLRLVDIIKAGERLQGMAVLWEVATLEEWREMVLLLLVF